MRFVTAILIGLLALPQIADAATQTVRPLRYGVATSGYPIELSCGPGAESGATVVIPWSRSDLPSSVMAGQLTRITFATGPTRKSYYGFPTLRTVKGKTMAVFDLDAFSTSGLVSLLHSSIDVVVASNYGSYRVRSPKDGPCL